MHLLRLLWLTGSAPVLITSVMERLRESEEEKNYQDATLSNCISICFGPLFGVVSAAVSQMSHLYPLTQGFW